MPTQTKQYPIYKSCFYRLRSPKKLAEILLVSPQFLSEIATKDNYVEYEAVIKGKSKTIYAPKTLIRKLGKRINDLFQRIETPSWVKFGKKGISYIDNATFHKLNPYIYEVDIRTFYESSRFQYVAKMFTQQFEMSKSVAKLMAYLVTHKGFIPRGGNASQIIAYWTFATTFNKIFQIASSRNITMSLYVDDITFSSGQPIPEKISYYVNKELKKVGHELNLAKTKSYTKSQYKIVTGVAICPVGSLRVSNKHRKSIIDDIKKSKSISKLSLLGKIRTAQNIENKIFQASQNKITQ